MVISRRQGNWSFLDSSNPRYGFYYGDSNGSVLSPDSLVPFL